MANRLFISEAASLALHTMAILAAQPDRRFTNQELAQSLSASGNHLAKVMQRLSRVGLVDAVVGPKGGFRLRTPGHQVKLLAIYELMDGPLEVDECLLGEPICDGKGCALGDVFQSMTRQLRDYLANTTLAELAGGLALQKRLVGRPGPAMA